MLHAAFCHVSDLTCVPLVRCVMLCAIWGHWQCRSHAVSGSCAREPQWRFTRVGSRCNKRGASCTTTGPLPPLTARQASKGAPKPITGRSQTSQSLAYQASQAPATAYVPSQRAPQPLSESPRLKTPQPAWDPPRNTPGSNTRPRGAPNLLSPGASRCGPCRRRIHRPGTCGCPCCARGTGS